MLSYSLGNREFEKKIESGKITFDHTGKLLNVKQLKAENLPRDFRQLMEHKVEARKSRKKDKAENKEKQQEDDIFKAKGNVKF